MAEPSAADRPVRERVLDATASITVGDGWGAVTMAKVAGLAGVSRQTVYNEYGAKPALGQAMVLRELDRFLTVVGRELDTHDDLVDAIRAAAEQTLLLAQDNPLLNRVLASAPDRRPPGLDRDPGAGPRTRLRAPYPAAPGSPMSGIPSTLASPEPPGADPSSSASSSGSRASGFSFGCRSSGRSSSGTSPTSGVSRSSPDSLLWLEDPPDSPDS